MPIININNPIIAIIFSSNSSNFVVSKPLPEPSVLLSGLILSDTTKLEELLEKIMAIIGLLILIIGISFIAPITNIFIYLFKGFVYIITLPFKLIKKSSNNNKKNKR